MAHDTTARLEAAAYYEPVSDEIETYDLPVSGHLPPELTGRYVRNGPNALPGAQPTHPFTEPGMLHGIRLSGGAARWYRNRWLRTKLNEGASPWRPDGTRDLTVGSANTHVIEHAGRMLALVESCLPHEVDRELNTLGIRDFDGRLTTAMTAHPKTDPVTGDLHFFGYGVELPHVTYHHMSASGELLASVPVDVPAPTLMHDFAITEHHVVWLDLPVVFDGAPPSAHRPPYRWSDTYGARLGVMPLGGGAIQWFDIEPCYVFHVGNAREDAHGHIVLDAIRYERGPFADDSAMARDIAATGDGRARKPAANQRLFRWTLHPRTGSVRETGLDDREIEFPTINEQFVGRANRFLYAVGDHPASTAGHAIVKYDLASDSSEAHRTGSTTRPGEAVFVPAADARAEDEGWLLSVTTDPIADRSELLVLDATDLGAAPVAVVHLPRRVPSGFHGSWIPDA